MTKIAVFDTGFGGELFAKHIEDEFPLFDVIRVIDWDHEANKLKKYDYIKTKIKPYVGRVDGIVIADQYYSITCLDYLRKEFGKQKFSGFPLKIPNKQNLKKVLIITTKNVHKTTDFIKYAWKIKAKVSVVECDEWNKLVDDGEYYTNKVYADLEKYDKSRPSAIILADSHLMEIKPFLRKIFGPTIAIFDGYDAALNELCGELRIRGRTGKKYR